MVDLSVAEYDRIEQQAISQLPNMIIKAYQPVTFYGEGYPTRVQHEFELFKYVDVMEETLFESTFSHLLKGLTVTEFELLQRLTKLISQFSESNFGRKAIARPTVLLDLNVLRHIKFLFGEARPRIFEIGPGCGYLGALLMMEGYPYAATDVTQAFYLYQNHFWNFISDGKVTELAHENSVYETFPAMPPGSATHIPWWKFVDTWPRIVPSFDVVTGNHALCEMHDDSLIFTLKSAQAFLQGREARKAFLFEGWGGQRQNNRASLTERFYRLDFALAHYDRGITIFTPRGTEDEIDSLSLPNFRRRQYQRLRNVARRSLLKSPFVNATARYEPHYYSSTRNPLSNAVLSGRQTEERSRTVDISQVKGFYTDLLGSEDHQSPDERFRELVRFP